MTLSEAVRVAVEAHRDYMGGAVIVRDGDGYDTIPGAYLSDISYTGPRDVAAEITDLCDWAGPEAYDASEGDVVAFVVEAIGNA
jgi:hypothetical protein